MPSIFRKNIHLCFFKIRCLPSSESPPLTLEDDDDGDRDVEYFDHIPNIITINNIPHQSLIVSNFNSIYDNPSTSSSSTAATTAIIDDLFSSSFSTSSATEYPDFSAIFASQRLFVSSPGLTNSILESPSSALGDGDHPQERLVGGGLPIKKDSPDPYADFRRSMQEMVEARKIEKKRNRRCLVVVGDTDEDNDESDDLSEYLNELLLCYLNLNPKHNHKFIFGAFADLLVSLMLPHCDDSDREL